MYTKIKFYVKSAFAYSSMYHKGRLHEIVDACSRLLLKVEYTDPPVTVESVLFIRQLNDRHLNAPNWKGGTKMSYTKSTMILYPGWMAKKAITKFISFLAYTK